jgi:protease IV
MQFLKYVLASFVAILLFFFIGFFILIGIATIAGNSSKPSDLKEKSVLQFSFDKRIVEQGVDDPFEDLDLPFTSPEEGIGLNDIKRSIKNAALDPKILGLYLNFSNFPGGLAKAHEVRNALIEFKKCGKPILFYGDYLSEGGYYLASVADSVFLNPGGILELNGANFDFAFFKGTLDKLEIIPEVFKVGKYKSAVEPFTRTEMSEENREQSLALLESIYGHFISEVSDSRNIDPALLERITNGMLARTPEDAREFDLIDGVLYRDQAYDRMKLMLGLEKDDELPLVKLSKYKKLKSHIEEPDTRDRIAVLVAEGEIREGKSSDGVIGSKSLIKEIKKLKKNDRVKAVVLRINSPGGGGLASDEIWREIQLLKEEKPVVSSMSDLAASGGYYIAMGTDYIFAQPNTITGSIGVFALLFDMTDFFKNKIGVTRDNIKTGEYADILNPMHHMSEEEREIVQSFIDHFYESFTQKAADGRKISIEEIKKVAQGRVWTGSQGIKIGLVDEIGDLDLAVKKAANLASVEEYKVKFYPRPKPFFERFFEGFSTSSVNSIIKEELGILYPMLSKAKSVNAKKGLWTRLPLGWSVSY